LHKINTFDIDGVIYMGEGRTGVRPHQKDIIITGRSYTQKDETLDFLRKYEIWNEVHFNPLARDNPKYSRLESGKWKAKVLTNLKKDYIINLHFEDDPIQIEEILKVHPDQDIVHLHHDLTEK
tara:strand:- start:92 stop:460 length:369 start_codon:yes stop_codon:yes gene_type:complete